MQQSAAAVCKCTGCDEQSTILDPFLVPINCLQIFSWSYNHSETIGPYCQHRQEVRNKTVAAILQSNVFYPYASLSSRICKCNKTIFIHEYRLNSDDFIFGPMEILSKEIKKKKSCFKQMARLLSLQKYSADRHRADGMCAGMLIAADNFCSAE